MVHFLILNRIPKLQPDFMKKLFVVFSFAVFLLACEKDNTFSESDIPDWLKSKISESEEIIESNPNSVASITAWLRFKYNGVYYYEFENPLSSAYREVYTSDGTPLISTDPIFFDYQFDKCCRKYVWKGPSYFTV